jgi:hypothetical protein
MTTPVLTVSLRERDGEIYGTIKHCANSAAVLESLAVVIEQFAQSCGVSPSEICEDINGLIK